MSPVGSHCRSIEMVTPVVRTGDGERVPSARHLGPGEPRTRRDALTVASHSTVDAVGRGPERNRVAPGPRRKGDRPMGTERFSIHSSDVETFVAICQIKARLPPQYNETTVGCPDEDSSYTRLHPGILERYVPVASHLHRSRPSVRHGDLPTATRVTYPPHGHRPCSDSSQSTFCVATRS